MSVYLCHSEASWAAPDPVSLGTVGVGAPPGTVWESLPQTNNTPC